MSPQFPVVETPIMMCKQSRNFFHCLIALTAQGSHQVIKQDPPVDFWEICVTANCGLNKTHKWKPCGLLSCGRNDLFSACDAIRSMLLSVLPVEEETANIAVAG